MTSRRAASSVVILLNAACAAAALSWGAPCFADEPASDARAVTTEQRAERAEQYAAQGFDAYARGDYTRAAALYRNAFELVPSADLLYNIARVYDAGLHDRARALHFYQRYVGAPGAVRDRIEKANRRLAELRAAERAMLEGPGVDAPEPAPAAPMTEPIPAWAEPARATAEPAIDWSAPRIAAVACGVTGLIGVGIGTGYGMAALLEPEAGPGSPAREDDNASVATLALLAGGTLLGTGAVLWLVSPDTRSDRPSSDGVRVNAALSTSKLGLELHGTW